MNEDQFCQKLEECYRNIRPGQKQDPEVRNIYIERLSWLVLAAGTHSNGSKRLDAVLTRIQKESPTLVVPRHVMTPAELEKFLAGVATDDANDATYAAYRRSLRYMSEWIAQAKQSITARSGFKFDTSVSVIRAQ